MRELFETLEKIRTETGAQECSATLRGNRLFVRVSYPGGIWLETFLSKVIIFDPSSSPFKVLLRKIEAEKEEIFRRGRHK